MVLLFIPLLLLLVTFPVTPNIFEMNFRQYNSSLYVRLPMRHPPSNIPRQLVRAAKSKSIFAIVAGNTTENGGEIEY